MEFAGQDPPEFKGQYVLLEQLFFLTNCEESSISSVFWIRIKNSDLNLGLCRKLSCERYIKSKFIHVVACSHVFIGVLKISLKLEKFFRRKFIF